jgi:hypothetical protein
MDRALRTIVRGFVAGTWTGAKRRWRCRRCIGPLIEQDVPVGVVLIVDVQNALRVRAGRTGQAQAARRMLDAFRLA